MPKIKWLVLASLATVALLFQPIHAQPIPPVYWRAAQAMGDGDYPTARRLFATMLTGKDFYFNAYWRLTQCYAFEGRFDQCQVFFENLLKSDAPAGEVYSALAFLSEFRGDRKRAAEYCWKAVHNRTAFLSIHQKLIDLAPAFGLESQVREHLTSRIAQNPKDWLAQYARAYWESLRARPEVPAAQFAELVAAGHKSWRVYFRWSIQLILMGKLDSACAVIDQGLAAAAEIDDKEGSGQLLQLEGYIYVHQAHLNRADSILSRAEQLSREIGYLDLQADLAATLSGLRLRQGRLQQALRQAQTAEMLSTKLNHANGKLQAHHYVADAYRSMGFYEKAKQEWTRAYQMADSLNHEVNRHLMAHNLASVYQTLGDHQKARSYFYEAIAYARKNRQTLFLVSFLRSLAGSLVELNLLREAKDCYDEALAIAEKNGLLESKCYIMSSLARFWKKSDNWPMVEQMATEALALARRASIKGEMIEALIKLGEVAEHNRKFTAAEGYFHQAQHLSAEAGFYTAAIASMSGLGRIATANGNNQRAVTILDEAATIVSRRVLSPAAGSTSSLLPVEKELFFALSRAYVRLQQPQRALEIAEQMRDLVVRRRLQQIRSIKFAAVADSLRRQNAHLDTLLLQKRLQLANILPSDSVNASAMKLRLEIAQFESQQNQLWERIGLAIPQNFRDDFAAQLAGLQKELSTRSEVAVDYLVGEQGVLVFALDGDTLLTAEVQIGKSELRHLVGKVNSALRYALQDSQDVQLISPLFFHFDPAAAFGLYQMLLARFVDEASGEKLLLIPDEDLHFLPFEILLQEAAADTMAKDYRTLPFVLQNHTVRYASSLQAAMNRHSFQRRTLATVLAVAQSPPRLDEIGNNAVDLWQMQSEVKAIRKILGNAAVRIVDGPFSNAGTWRGDLNQHSILHFAAHSEAQNAEPLSSRIILEEHDTGAMSLYAFEIAAMQLSNGQLAFLSSCNTASGILRGSEGIQGFVQAFRSAGVPGVIGSLWPADAEASSRLAAEFYSRLRRGETAAAALRQAKLSLLASDKASPFFWAAFQYYGVDQSFRFRQELSFTPFGAVLFLAFVIGAVRKFRERRITGANL
jgi:CHAT domain-containing protein